MIFLDIGFYIQLFLSIGHGLLLAALAAGRLLACRLRIPGGCRGTTENDLATRQEQGGRQPIAPVLESGRFSRAYLSATGAAVSNSLLEKIAVTQATLIRIPSSMAAVIVATLVGALIVIPVAAAANVQVLWSNDPPLEGLRFGDFDGNGRTDVFRMNGNQWQYSRDGVGPWEDLFADPTSTPLEALRFGDFNGDGRTDVFSVFGEQWRYSSAGVSSWIPLASDPTPLEDLRFGDFNGDGRTDVFGVDGIDWRYSPGGASNWQPLASDTTPLEELRFGDFNGDGRTDVFSSAAGQWRYSASGTAAYQLLRYDPIAVQDLRFGDFDADGITDVFKSDGSRWHYSSGGLYDWMSLASDSTPLSELRFGDFDGDRRTDVFSISGGQWRYSSGARSSWIYFSQGAPTPTNTTQPAQPGMVDDLRFGDFDGDGRTDVFIAPGGQWQFSPAAVGPWQRLAYDPLPLEELRFGDAVWVYRTDFNGDGRTDVFSVDGEQWRYSDAGASNWITLARDAAPLSELRFGDFEGDGRTDVFTVAADGRWLYSDDGTTDWAPLAIDGRFIHDLRFGDFNGDGRTDVFSIQNGQWQYSSAGISDWIPIASDTTPLQDLRFGDFNGDGRTDVFSVDGDQWRYSSAGMSNWILLARDSTPLHQLRFGDFNGDGRTDVFSVGPDGRWRYSSGGASNWMPLGPPEEITLTPTPTRWPTSSPTPTRWPSPTITRTPIPPPTPDGCANIIVNGDMESNAGWLFGDSPVPAKYAGVQRHSGQRSVQLGILPDSGAQRPSYSSVRQPVTIPSNATTARLRWWRLYRTEEAPNSMPNNMSDRQEVILLSPQGKTLKILHRVRLNEGAWQEEVVDITEFIGQTFYVYFNTYNDGNPARTWMFLDDVSVDICYPQPVAVPLGASVVEPMAGSMGAAYSMPGSQPMPGAPSMPMSQTAMGPGSNLGVQPMPDTQMGAQIASPVPPAYVPASPTPMPTATTAATPTSTPTSIVASSAPVVQGQLSITPLPAIPADTIEAQVVRILDGDTVEVLLREDMDPAAVYDATAPAIVPAGYRADSVAQAMPAGSTMLVRYADINAPSIDTEEGLMDAEANRELVDGETVFLEITGPLLNSDGAIGAYVFLADGELVNAVLVRQGHAVVAPTVADSKYEARLLASQALAQETGSGIWLLTPIQLDAPGAEPAAQAEAPAAAAPADTPAATETAAATATAEPTAGESSGGCVELVTNGSFEQGDVGWNLIAGTRTPVLTDQVTFRESTNALQLGIVDGENVASISAADQQVELPVDVYSIILSLRYMPVYDASPGPGDLQYVDVYNAMTGQFAGRVMGGQRNDGVWLAANYDLSLLAGQPVRIVFAVNNDGVEGASAMYVDNVSILACEFGASPPADTMSGATPESAGTDATPTLQTALTASEEASRLSTGRTWLARMFTGAVMLGVLTIIGFAALVIMNSSTPSGGASGDKPEGDSDKNQSAGGDDEKPT